MSYKVFIPTAGLGSRLHKATKHINKSLITVDFKPAISHIIDKFSKKCEFVIALGYKGDLVKDYLSLSHPQSKIIFKKIKKFKGPSSGLGHTLLECKHLLNEPFVFISCDTLVSERIPDPDKNWIGYAESENIFNYRTIKLNEAKNVTEINEKGKRLSDNSRSYIGLSGIYDVKLFWDVMQIGKKSSINKGEAYGLLKMINHKKIYSNKFTWYDIGNTTSLKIARNIFKNHNYQILEKEKEAIWFTNTKVIKFSTDEKFIKRRVERAKYLKGFVPKILSYNKNMYSYKKIKGEILSNCITLPLFEEFLDHSKYFWTEIPLNLLKKKKFYSICDNFYRKKTFERVGLFYKNFNKKDKTNLINNQIIPELKKIFKLVKWNNLSRGKAVRFHGDYHFENILVTPKTSSNKFLFLDWRQDFGDIINYGDVYYDLAKILHGIIINHKIINDKNFNIKWNKDIINFNFFRTQTLVDCENFFYGWVNKNNYDLKKIKILTALIYLNIAALHHYPYSLLLYSIGKKMLFDQLK